MKPNKLSIAFGLLSLLIVSLIPVWAQTNDGLTLTNVPVGSVVITNGSGSNPVIHAAAAAANGNTLLLGLLPLLVPTIIAGVKAFCAKFLPKVPTWTLPLAAPLIGFTADWITSLITGNSSSPIMAVVLGLAGTGVREIFNQVANSAKDGSTTIAESKAEGVAKSEAKKDE